MTKMKFNPKVALILLFACMLTLFVGCTKEDPVLFGGATDFTAKLYAQYVPQSYSYILEVTVSDGNVYINDILYDKVNYVENPGVEFYPANLYWHPEESEQTADIFEQIKACKKCYLLEIAEAEENLNYGRKIAVYEINGTYYFAKIGIPKETYIHYFKPVTGG